MRRIRGSLFVSLDGVIQAPGGPSEDPTGDFAHGGWLPQFFDEAIGGAIDAFFGKEYDLLLGRRTYDIFAAYWPYVGGEASEIGEVFDTAGKHEGEAAAIAMGEAFTRAKKYVLTRGSPDLGWSNSHRLGSMEEVAALKQGDGPDLLIQGSGSLYPALIAARNLDRLTLMTLPLVLGRGKRWFEDSTPGRTFRLLDQQTTRSGATIATYEPTGEIGHGWAGPQSTSKREDARQRAMAEGRW
jgi:dihydrofolate reductase